MWGNGSSKHYLGTDFGGKKNSGVGTEEGLAELLGYTETKTVHVMVDGTRRSPARRRSLTGRRPPAARWRLGI